MTSEAALETGTVAERWLDFVFMIFRARWKLYMGRMEKTKDKSLFRRCLIRGASKGWSLLAGSML